MQVNQRKQQAATKIQSCFRRKKAISFSEKKIFAIQTIQMWWREILMKFKSRFAQRNKATVKNLMKNNVNNKQFGMSAINNIKKHIETNIS